MPKFLQKLGALLGRPTLQRQAATDLQAILAELSRLRRRVDEIPRCIELCRHALAVVDKEENAELWGVLQIELGDRLVKSPEGLRAENLEKALAHYRQALDVRTRQDYPEPWARIQYAMALVYQDRIDGERAENLEQAIAHYGQALEVYTRQAYPERWAGTQNNLANTYRVRICGERAENLERAIMHFGRALEVHTRQAYPEDWARSQNNIGTAYSERIRGERAENLELAIAHYRQALDVYTRQKYPQGWARTQNNLGNTYGARIRGERADNIEQAIVHYRQALEVRTRQAYPEDCAMTQNNLATAYTKRMHGESAENLEHAIAYCQQAIKVYTRQAHPERWATTLNNLANAYRNRIRGEKGENLEQAIEHCQQALNVYTRQAYPEGWAMSQNNLAIAYEERIHGERAENLEQAIAHYRHVLDVYTQQAHPEDWARIQYNLANVYQKRVRGERVKNLDLAITHYRQALSVQTLDRFPADFQSTQRNVGHLHFGKTDWAQALAAYREAIRAEQLLLAAAYTETGRQSETAQTSGLYAPAAYALLKLDRPGEALVQLEQGKTRLLSRALALDGVDLSPLPAADQETLRSERQTIRELEAEMRLPSDTPARRDERALAEALAQARSRLNETIARIRVNHPDFMHEGLALAEILCLIPEGAVLVAPLVTEQGCAVFIVPGGVSSVSGEHVLWSDDFKDADLQMMLRGPAQEKEWGGWLGAYFNAGTNHKAWLDGIDSIGQALWDRLIGPIAKRLASLEARQVLLMPQGGLGLLPLHAAWHEVDGQRRHFLDDYSVTWLSSAYTRRVSEDRLHDAARQKRNLLAVVDPSEDLPFTLVEGEQVARLFADGKSAVLAGRQATSEALKQRLKEHSASYLHFACHGSYDWADPMRSGLLLAGKKPLTLAQIIGEFTLDGMRLITLSACETGITDIRQSPDEYLGLPAGFLQAGAPAVVSTLWAVNDLSTMLLIERFYRLHLQGKEIPSALQQAQIWLREVSAGELAKRFTAEEDEALRALKASTRMPIEAASAAFARFAAQDPDHRPFAHPYYWAAFTFSGA